MKLLTSNFIGGVSFMIFYGLIVAVPSYLFSIALILLTTLIFGKGIFSNHRYSKYLTYAMSAFFIFLGGSFGEGASFVEKFITNDLLCGRNEYSRLLFAAGFSQSAEKKPYGW